MDSIVSHKLFETIAAKQRELYSKSLTEKNKHKKANRYINNIHVLSRANYNNIPNFKIERGGVLFEQFNSNHSLFLTTNNELEKNNIYQHLYKIENGDIGHKLRDISFKHIQCGIDEAGRGPLFGRLYVAGVVYNPIIFNETMREAVFDEDECKEIEKMLPLIRDSKKYPNTNHKKINSVYDFIKKYALAYHVEYIEADVIDTINIRNAVHKGMNTVVEKLREIIAEKEPSLSLNMCLIDGCDFVPDKDIKNDEWVCIEGGDNLFISIASASILAKVDRDRYIDNLCEEYPFLSTLYGIDSNKGYGTREHCNGVETYGITPWHRVSYGRCKTAKQLSVADLIGLHDEVLLVEEAIEEYNNKNTKKNSDDTDDDNVDTDTD